MLGGHCLISIDIHVNNMLVIFRHLFHHRLIYTYYQKVSLVNIKLKWVKDRKLDAVLAGERDLRAAWELKDKIIAHPTHCLPVYHLSKRRQQLGLSHVKVSSFMRRYPTVFQEFQQQDDPKVPWFRLTSLAAQLHEQELETQQATEANLVERLCRLLMLTFNRILPLETIDQLKWDMGLPNDYPNTLIPRYSQFFKFVSLPDGRSGLQLCIWDECLAISELERCHFSSCGSDRTKCSEFPLKFTRGFGLKRKCMMWLQEWQKLPCISPYADSSDLDHRTDVSEKRIVGVFHELLHLTMGKKTQRRNLSNLRKPFQLPQKFTKVFERHPGIFYLSRIGGTETVFLREAYEGCELIQKHPLLQIREKLADMMKQGKLDKSRGLYREGTCR